MAVKPGSCPKGATAKAACAAWRFGRAVGDRGTILRSTDAGTNWEAIPSNTMENLTDVSWGEKLAVAVGHKGITLVSSDDGKSWKTVPTARGMTLHRVSVVGDKVFVVGEKGTVLQIEMEKLQ